MILNIHQKISLCTVSVLFMLLLYEQLFHLSLGIGHLLFEIAESILDLAIDFFFETGTRETQIIVFYILFSFICYKAYKFYRAWPKFLSQVKKIWQQQKSETLSQWKELSIHWKMAWSAFFLVLMNSWLFLM